MLPAEVSRHRRQAAITSAWVSVGGIIGGFSVGFASTRLRLKSVVVAAQVGAAISIALLGNAPANLALLTAAAAVAGFFTIGAMIGLYAVIARTFPAQMRAGGTGFVIGCGRVGSAVSPAVAGMLFTAGLHFGAVSALMALPAVLSAAMLVGYRLHEDDATAAGRVRHASGDRRLRKAD